MTTPHLLIQELRRRRIAAGRGQFDFPGLDHSMISAWETGRRSPSVENLEAYARALGARVAFRRRLR